MRAAVITGGRAPGATIILRHAEAAELVVAADSGLSTALACGLVPDLVVGDFDSLQDLSVLAAFDEDRIHRFPSDKDETDTEIGFRMCREHGADDIVIIGGGGQDAHFVAILSLFDRPEPPACWITDTAEFRTVSDRLRIEGRKGDVVGFIPIGCEPCRMRSSGLRWPLDSVEWKKGDVGVSNELSGNIAEVEMVSGRLLMIRDLEA